MLAINFNHHMIDHAHTWDMFTSQDHETWKVLFKRQAQLLKNRAAAEVIAGIEDFRMNEEQIPKFSDLNHALKNKTGFEIIPVKGFIPEDLFFTMLANRCFPSTYFIRKPEQLDYLQEPDIFHDVFGHVPLLINPVFADFMQLFGIKGLEAMQHGLLEFAATLYWYTVEFGLIASENGLRIYGAGITSSYKESIYALEENTSVAKIKFNLLRLMCTHYHTDALQQTYFVISKFEDLFNAIRNLCWKDCKYLLLQSQLIPQGAFINTQEIFGEV